MERAPLITRRHLSLAVFIVARIGFLFCVALLIGAALTALSFVGGTVVAFVLVVLVVGLLALELPTFWARLPR